MELSQTVFNFILMFVFLAAISREGRRNIALFIRSVIADFKL